MKLSKYWILFIIVGFASTFGLPPAMVWIYRNAPFVTEYTFPVLCGLLLMLVITVPFGIIALIEDDRQMKKEAEGSVSLSDTKNKKEDKFMESKLCKGIATLALQLIDSYESNSKKFILIYFIVWGLMMLISISILILKVMIPSLIQDELFTGFAVMLIWLSPMIIALLIFKAKHKTTKAVVELVEQVEGTGRTGEDMAV